jgi:lipoprotein-anchoring transpeptidase ErfK/SrfK
MDLRATTALMTLSAIIGIGGVMVAADAAPIRKSATNKASATRLTAAPAVDLVQLTQIVAPRPVAVATTPMPLITVVSIGDQRVSVYAGETQVARSGVSTGTSDRRTPTGIFSVIGKERYHESNLYSNAPMPFMQRITWSGVALHEGNLPGYPASHGCIRLSSEFAQRLYAMSRMGMRVIVADRDLAPVAFSHPVLPSPTFVRAPDLTSLASSSLEPIAGRMQLGGATDGGAKPEGGRLLNPMERGRQEQGRAKAAALEAHAEAQALLEIASLRGQEARAAADTLRQAEAALRAIGAGRQAAADGLIRVATLADEERARLTAQSEALATAYEATARTLKVARADADAADAAAFHAAAEAKAAVAERDAAEQAARVADRATQPVSIFVSRKEHRVYVRQGFEPVFEADVEIAEPELRLGTHVLTAISAPDAANNQSVAQADFQAGSMKWVAVTIPAPGRAEAAPTLRGAKSTAGDARAVSRLPASAAAALDRITFSNAVLEAISSKLWTGASLIISDHGISTETGKGTDFVVLTK